MLEPITPLGLRRQQTTVLSVHGQPDIAEKDVPQGWLYYIPPSGEPYFHHTVDHITTRCDVRCSKISDTIRSWHNRIRNQGKDLGIRFSATTEIVIDLHLSLAPETCKYYLIDWDRKDVFWCEDVDTKALGMDMAFSDDHLKIAIEELFWTHVEYFSIHRSIPEKATGSELRSALVHTAIDQLTSESSNAPWAASDCERYLQLLSSSQGNDPKKVCTAARLWRIILRSRFQNFHKRDSLFHTVISELSKPRRDFPFESWMQDESPINRSLGFREGLLITATLFVLLFFL